MLYPQYFIDDLKARALLVRRSKYAKAISILAMSSILILVFASSLFHKRNRRPK